MLIKIQKPFLFQGKKYQVNEEIAITADTNNIPLDLFWRNRIKDAAIDGCVTIIENKKTNKKTDGTDIS